MKSAQPFESAESASPVISRLVAGVLRDQHEAVFSFSPWERLGMRILNALPVSLAQRVVRLQFSMSSLDPERAIRLEAETLASQRLQDYKELEGKYPVIVVGSALGGAAAHIAAVLRAPFLPQPFILGLRGGSPDDSLEAHLARTQSTAERILASNPELCAIGHFDPVHDGWLTRSVSHLRLKLIDLPEPYQTFIQDRLQPGGTILYLDCRAKWLQFPIADRFTYQVGGWGGIPAEEFIQGSLRIDRFLEATGSSHRGGWKVPGVEPEWMPESEWGSVGGLDRALQSFATRYGYRVVSLRFDHPHDYSRLALAAHQMLFESVGLEPVGLLVETFTQYDPYLALKAGLLPLWLVFNTSDSRDFLAEVLSELPENLPIYFSGLATLSRTPDMITWDGWVSAFKGRQWVSVGAGPHRYPEDLVALFRWPQRLRKLLPALSVGPPPSLTLSDFLKLIPR